MVTRVKPRGFLIPHRKPTDRMRLEGAGVDGFSGAPRAARKRGGSEKEKGFRNLFARDDYCAKHPIRDPIVDSKAQVSSKRAIAT